MYPDDTTKRCTKCGETKPLSAFYKQRSSPDGVGYYCRVCFKQTNALHYAQNHEYHLNRSQEWSKSHPDQVQAKSKRYYAENRERVIASVNEWRRLNPSKYSATRRLLYQRQIHARRQAKKQWYVKHRESHDQKSKAWRQQHPDLAHRYGRNWRAKNPLKQREIKQRRRALERSTMTERVSYEAIWTRDDGMCHICGDPVARTDVHFDHVVPLSKGGTHTYDNIKVAHSLCNRRKGAKLLA